MIYVLTLTDSSLTVTPVTPEVRKFLTITEKKLVQHGWQKKTIREEVPFYSVDPATPNIALTYQGIWKDLKEHLEGLGNNVMLVDNRNLTLSVPGRGS